MPTILFVLGGPGAGKGTQCQRLVADFNFVHLSTGDLLREEMARAGSEYSQLIGACIKEGTMVPDEVTLALLKAALERSPGQPILIDGYPRTMAQAEAFENQVASCKAVLYFRCSEAAMRERLLKRGLSSGRTDDNEEAIVKRFVTFNQTSLSVIQHYQERNLVLEVDTEDTPDNVYRVTYEHVAKLLKVELVGEQVTSPTVAKSDETVSTEAKNTNMKNESKNKGSVSSQNKLSDNELTSKTSVPLTPATSKPTEATKEFEVGSAPLEAIAPSLEDIVSFPATSAAASLETKKSSQDAPVIGGLKAVIEQTPDFADQLADTSPLAPIAASEQEKETSLLASNETNIKEETPSKPDAAPYYQALTEDKVSLNENGDTPEANLTDKVQEHSELKAVGVQVPQSSADFPGVSQALNTGVSHQESTRDSGNILATQEKHVDPDVMLIDQTVGSMVTSVPKERVTDPTAQDVLEKLEESFTIPAFPTELEPKPAEPVQEYFASDILRDIPSQSEATPSKLASIPSIPEEVVSKSDDFLGSFADQFQFSDFNVPDTQFNLPSFDVPASKPALEEESLTFKPNGIPTEPCLSKHTDKVAAHFQPSLEPTSPTQTQPTDQFTTLDENLGSKLSEGDVKSNHTDLPPSIDENLVQTEIASEIKYIQDQVESKPALTKDSVQHSVASLPEPISKVADQVKVNHPELSPKEITGDVNSRISNQGAAIDSSLTDKVTAIDSSLTDKVTAINSSLNDKVDAIKPIFDDHPTSIHPIVPSPTTDDSLPKFPTPATLSEKVNNIPIPSSPSSSSTPTTGSITSKSKKKSTCSLM